jgi:hypothetical protein
MVCESNMIFEFAINLGEFVSKSLISSWAQFEAEYMNFHKNITIENTEDMHFIRPVIKKWQSLYKTSLQSNLKGQKVSLFCQ